MSRHEDNKLYGEFREAIVERDFRIAAMHSGMMSTALQEASLRTWWLEIEEKEIKEILRFVRVHKHHVSPLTDKWGVGIGAMLDEALDAERYSFTLYGLKLATSDHLRRSDSTRLNELVIRPMCELTKAALGKDYDILDRAAAALEVRARDLMQTGTVSREVQQEMSATFNDLLAHIESFYGHLSSFEGEQMNVEWVSKKVLQQLAELLRPTADHIYETTLDAYAKLIRRLARINESKHLVADRYAHAIESGAIHLERGIDEAWLLHALMERKGQVR